VSGGADKDAKLWAELRAIDEDLLRADSPLEGVDRVLREAGADPEEVGRRGARFVAGLAKFRRLYWQDRARRRVTDMTAKMSRQLRVDLAGEELLAEVDRLRAHPALGGQLAAAFRSRNEEEMTDDERRDLLAEIEAVIVMAEVREGADGEEEA